MMLGVEWGRAVYAGLAVSKIRDCVMKLCNVGCAGHCRTAALTSAFRPIGLTGGGRRTVVSLAPNAFHLANTLFDLIEILHGLARIDAHLGKLARARKHLALERTDGLVVVIEAAAQIFTELRQVLGKRAETLIEIFAEIADLLGIFGEILLAPTVGHRAQQRNEAGRCGERHILAGRVFVQVAPCSRSCVCAMLSRCLLSEPEASLRSFSSSRSCCSVRVSAAFTGCIS